MMISTYIVTLSYGIGTIGIFGGLLAFIRFNKYKTTLSLQNDNIKALEDQANIHSAILAENKMTIDNLRTRVEVVETLPLEAILAELKTISNTQNQMLKKMIGT